MFFYLIYFLFNPLLYIILYFLKFFNKKIREHKNFAFHSIKKTIHYIDKFNQNKKKILLFHAASAGEFEQLKPILNNIDKNQFFIIQSFSSPTIFNKERNNNLFDIACYHPYDVFWQSYYFFSNLNPHAYIITRHDIWPIHLFITRILNIKTFYINANLHNNSIWCQWYMKKIAKTIFENIDYVFVPSKDIFQNAYKIIDSSKLYIMGDTRFDQIFNRYEKNKKLQLLPQKFHKTKNIIFGSYDKFDETMIIQSLSTIYKKGDISLKESQIGIILVPHEPVKRNIDEMINKLKKNKFKVQKFSDLKQKKEPSSIIIVDKIGVLADLYKYSQLAYVGAGFGRVFHSVIEPAVYNCVISFGPNIEMLNEAKDLYKNNLAYKIFKTTDMINFIQLNPMDTKHTKMKNSLNLYMRKNKNIANRVWEKIVELL